MGVPTATGGAVTEERLLEEGRDARARPTVAGARMTARDEGPAGHRGGRRGDGGDLHGRRARGVGVRGGGRAGGDDPAGPQRRRARRRGPSGVVGFAVIKGCELDLLYTRPRAWGRGAGRALLVAAEQALRDAGCGEVTLWTEERNERARRVYQASGWRPDGEVRERVWNGAPLRELRYRKLSPASTVVKRGAAPP